MTPSLRVVLLRPKEDGNVGAVARALRNFGVTDMVLVSPRAKLGPEARRRAMAGLPILQRARVLGSLEESVEDTDLVVGTTDLSGGRTRSYLRRSVTPEELSLMVQRVQGTVSLVFGPEDNGLNREELARCDVLAHIPADRTFPTLNLSHAVTVLLYVLHRGRVPAEDPVELHGATEALFFDLLERFLTECRYPPHKRKGLRLLFRRVLGRSLPSRYEYTMLLGFLRRAMYRRKGWTKTAG